MRESKKGFAFGFLLFSGLSCLAFTIAVFLHVFLTQNWTLTFLLTSGTIFYHFLMRLFVGYVVERICFRRLKENGLWFKEKSFEKKLYGFLRLKKWKGNLPTYNPSKFDFKRLTTDELISNTLQAEAVHETIALFSFLPVALYWITFDVVDLVVYLLTSFLAAAFDTLFVLLQRYNRFRLLRLREIERKKRQ